MLQKWPYFDQNHGLTLLEKYQFFEFLNFLFLLITKALFRSSINVKVIFLTNIALKKGWKNGHIWTKTIR